MFYQSKLKIQFYVTLYGTSQSNISVVLKGKNSIAGLMSDIAMFDFFYILFAREKSPTAKKKGEGWQKCGKMENLFIIKSMHCFKLINVSN